MAPTSRSTPARASAHGRVAPSRRLAALSLGVPLLGVASLLGLGAATAGCSLQICEVATCDAAAGQGGSGGSAEGGGGAASCEPACVPGANATAECVSGACVYACQAGFGDCDDEPSDCEADLASPSTCGSCTHACASGECLAIDGTLACNDPVEIAAGDDHTCVRKTSGSVFCWGDNGDGQVGSSPASMFEDLPQRVQIAPDVRASRLIAGGNASCLLDAAGAVFCWGNSASGEGAAPVPSTDGSSAVAVWGPFGVVLRSGSVSVFDTSPPYADPSGFFVGASAIARGETHGCAVRSANAIHCWGDNGAGQLGIDPATPSLVNPTVPVPGFVAVEVAVGDAHTCARTAADDLHCWGSSVDLGQVGHGVYENVHVPQLVLRGVDRMRLGPATSAAISAGELYLWGANGARQVATTQAPSLAVPTKREDLEGVVDVALGDRHSCVLTDEPAVVCFGANDDGQLGVGNATPSPNPLRVVIPAD